MANTLLILAAGHGLVAVAAGAFGAHGLKGRLTPDLLSAWQTGSQYQLVHAVALAAVALALLVLPGQAGAPWLRGAAWAWCLGALLFSGSLYWLALGGPRWLGPVTPVGGLALMAGWLALLVAGWRQMGPAAAAP